MLAVVGAVVATTEFGIRWSVEGGFAAALASFRSGAEQRPFAGSRDGLVFDEELGYRPDPQPAATNPLDVTNPAAVPAKAPGAARILIVDGPDPQAQPGARPDHFVNRLRRAFGESAEVLDGSVVGYTSHQKGQWLAGRLTPLKPDLIVVTYNLNDNHPFLYRLDPAWGLVLREQARRALLPADESLAAHLTAASYLVLRLRLGLRDWQTPADARFPWEFDARTGPAWRDETWKGLENEFALLKSTAERSNADLLLAIFPIADQFDPEQIERDAQYVFKPQIKALEAANRLRIAALDLTPEFQRQDGRTLFEPNGFELNSRGHVLAADALRKRILDSDLLPERSAQAGATGPAIAGR